MTRFSIGSPRGVRIAAYLGSALENFSTEQRFLGVY